MKPLVLMWPRLWFGEQGPGACGGSISRIGPRSALQRERLQCLGGVGRQRVGKVPFMICLRRGLGNTLVSQASLFVMELESLIG